MLSFRKAKAQADYAIRQKLEIGKARHGYAGAKKIHSLGTQRNYLEALTRLTEWLQANRLGDLKHLNAETALQYLEQRGQLVSQKTLDQERQAIQLHLGFALPVIKSELTQALKSRAYTPEQIQLIANAQTLKYKLATQIASAAGLRAHELLTLRKQSMRSASTHREWSNLRFRGRCGEIYTVIGKGGLIREVLIPTELAKQLEALRLPDKKIIKDRTINYTAYYDMGGGKAWSDSFSSASKRILGWSHGAHGLRHSYAQQRLSELQQQGYLYQHALSIVSQELGHFRPDITEIYLR